MCALPASIHPPEQLIHVHTHTQLHGPSTIRLLQDTYLGHGQEAGRSCAHELPSSLHPLRNLPLCCSSASKPLSPRSPGAVGAGVKATCPAEGPRATRRASMASSFHAATTVPAGASGTLGGHAQSTACVPHRSPSLQTIPSSLLFVFQFILFLRRTQASPR